MSDKSPRVAVIGGGLSGLVSAFCLQQQLPDARITVFERRDRLGGVIRTERVDRFLLEMGADSFSLAPPGVEQLCEQLGLTDRLVAPRDAHRRALILHRDSLLSVPEGFALLRPAELRRVLRSPLFSWPGRLRLMAEWFVKGKTDQADESLEQFATRRFGREVFERLIQPLVAGIYTADAAKLSMQATMPQFVEMERNHGGMIRATRAIRKKETDDVARSASGARYQQFRSFPGGMQELFDALSQRIGPENICFNSPVENLQRLANQDPRDADGNPTGERSARGTWSLTLAGGVPQPFDAVLMALPGPQSSQILQSVDARAAQLIGGVPYASSALVLLAVRKTDVAHPLDAFGLVVPAVARRKIIAASFLNRKFDLRCPEDHHLIRVFIGGAMQGDLLAADDDALIALARSELADIIGLRGEPTLQRVQRWNQAMPQYHVGHCQRRQEFRDSIQSLGGLEIAGNAMEGVGIAHCVRTAQSAAARIASYLNSSPLATE